MTENTCEFLELPGVLWYDIEYFMCARHASTTYARGDTALCYTRILRDILTTFLNEIPRVD